MYKRKGDLAALEETLFMASFLVLLFAKAIGLYDGQPLYTFLLVAGVLLFVAKVIVTDHTLLEYAVIAVIFGSAVFLWRRTGEKGLLLCACMMLGVKNTKPRRVFRWGGAVWILSFLSILFLTQCGFVPERVLLHPKHWVGLAICHSFGYPHPNVLHISYVILLVFLFYLLDPHLRVGEIFLVSVLMMAGNIYLFLRSMSFTGLAFGTIYLILNFYFCARKNYSKAERFLIQAILPVCWIFSIAGPLFFMRYSQRIFDLIDSILNTRYHLSYLFLTGGDIAPIGHRLVIEDLHCTMDVSYVYLLVQMGVIPFAIVSIAFFLLVRDCLNHGRRYELAVVLGLSIAGISEPFLFNDSFKNLNFLFLGYYLYRSIPQTEGLKKLREWKRHIGESFAAVADMNLLAVRVSAVVFGRGLRQYLRFWRRNLIRFGLIFFVCVAAALSSYHYLVPPPQRIYVGESFGYGYISTPVTMNEAELKLLSGQGDMLVGPRDPNETYVTVPDRTRDVEYIGMATDVGVWLGLVVVALLSMLTKALISSLRRRRGRVDRDDS